LLLLRSLPTRQPWGKREVQLSQLFYNCDWDLWHLCSGTRIPESSDPLQIVAGTALKGDKFLDEQVVREFIQRYVHHGYLERGRNGKMTDEWIAFAKQDNETYYLTLGAHTEDDEAIWRRCKSMCS
jgi:hypothetical protein